MVVALKTIVKLNKLSMRKILLMMAAILCAGMSYAQNIAVSGVVTDAEDGEPLMGVSVAVMGTTMGAATDLDGRYSLSVPTGSSLTFSYLGYNYDIR